MSRWNELPAVLLNEIGEHLGYYVEKIRFKCVCTHWQSTSPELPDLRQPQPPWLLMPCKSGSMCKLYHPLENKVYEIDLPEAGEKVFKGTGYGWVVTVQQNGSISVVNPLTRVRVPLPPNYKFADVLKYRPDKPKHEYLYRQEAMKPIFIPQDSMHVRNARIGKIVLCSSPLSKDFRAVAIYGSVRLAYCKVGDKKWSDLVEFGTSKCGNYTDVTFYDGKLHAITVKGQMMICDDIVSCPKLRRCTSIPVFKGLYSNIDHLVNSTKGLAIVRRAEDIREIGEGEDTKDVFSTIRFTVFKLDIDSSSWISFESLGGDEILFMGLGIQMGISSHSLKRSNENRIYFASNQLIFGCEDIKDCFNNGVFSFEDRSIKLLEYKCNPKVI